MIALFIATANSGTGGASPGATVTDSNTNTYTIRSFGAAHSGFEARCNLPGWLEKMSFWVKAKHKPDALERKDRDFGTRMVVQDNDRVVLHGYVYAVDVDGLHVRYECVGPWRRHANQFYVGPIDPADDIATVLQDVLSTNVPAVYVNALNFDANATAAKDLFRQEIEAGLGVLPVDAVKAILSMRGPSETNAFPLYDYYCLPRDLVNGLPQLDTAVYAVRDKERTYADWYIRRRDLLPEDAGEHSHIYEYQSTVTIAYGKVQGTATGGGANQLIDTSKNFLEEGVQVQDMATNLTTDSSAWVAGISTTTNPNDTLAVVGVDFGGNPEYSIRFSYDRRVYQSAQASGTAYTDLWTSVAAPYEFPELNSTQAAQLAGEMVADLSNPILQQPFTIGSGYVRDVNGGYWPVWALLRRPSYIRLVDSAISNNADNIDLIERLGMFTTALDYSHDDRTLTVTPTQPSDRLDVRLQSAGILPGQTIEPVHRGMGWPTFGRGGRGDFFADWNTPSWFVRWLESQANYGAPRAHPYYGSGYQGSPYYNPYYWEDRAADRWYDPNRRR